MDINRPLLDEGILAHANGRLLPRRELDRMLADVEASNKKK
jgi:hypothetical protein